MVLFHKRFYHMVIKQLKKFGVSDIGSTSLALYNMYRSYRGKRKYGGSYSGAGRRTRARTATGRSRTLTRTRKKKSTSGVGVTGQYDRRTVYIKRRMPRYKRLAWKRFRNKVNAVAEKELGSQTVLFNNNITTSNTTSGGQMALTLALYPQQSAQTALSDLFLISNLGNESNPTLADGVSLDQSTKFIFQSAVLDITIQNASTYTAADSAVTNPSQCRLEVDVYEITMRKPSIKGTATVQSITDALAYNANMDRAIKDNNTTPSTTELSATVRGATPFEMGTSLGYWGIKVWKKTKYILSQGETITYQVRDPRRHTIEKQKIKDDVGCNQPGLTKFVYVIGKLTPQCTPIGSTASTYQEIMYVGCTRKYLYKVEGENDDRTLYISGK